MNQEYQEIDTNNNLKFYEKFLFFYKIQNFNKTILKLDSRTLTIILSVLAIISQIPAYGLFTDKNFVEIIIAIFNGFSILAFSLLLYSSFNKNINFLEKANIFITILNYIYFFGGISICFLEAYLTIPKAILTYRKMNGFVGDPFIYGTIGQNTLLILLLVSWFLGLLISLFLNYVSFSFYLRLKQMPEVNKRSSVTMKSILENDDSQVNNNTF